MARRSPQAQVALVAAGILLLVGASLAAVVIVGLVDGVTGTGPLLLGALALGVFALVARLLTLARRPATPPPTTTPTAPSATAAMPRQSPRGVSPSGSDTARPVHSRPQPRPKSMRP